jgi:GxxExxY protein
MNVEPERRERESAERRGGGVVRSVRALRDVPAAWNELTGRVIACAIEVHATIGPGLLERLYEEAMAAELADAGLRVERQRPLRLRYKGRELGDLRLDLVVEDLVIVEIKAVEQVHDVHAAQLLSYLRSADLPIGLLINFSHPRLTDGLHRRLNDRCSRLPAPPPRPSALSENSAFLPPGGEP